MKKLCLLLCLILCCLPVVAQTVESPAKKTEINQAGEEEKKEFDFSDDMEDFKGLFGRTQNVVAEVIPENQYEQFYEDYTVFQRTVKSTESVTYHIPYSVSYTHLVRIGHNNTFLISQLGQVKIVPDAGAQCHNNRF